MFFTLDRIEDGNIAVLISDDGKKTDIPANLLQNTDIGSVFRAEDSDFIFDEEETTSRRKRISEKRNRLFNRIK